MCDWHLIIFGLITLAIVVMTGIILIILSSKVAYYRNQAKNNFNKYEQAEAKKTDTSEQLLTKYIQGLKAMQLDIIEFEEDNRGELVRNAVNNFFNVTIPREFKVSFIDALIEIKKLDAVDSVLSSNETKVQIIRIVSDLIDSAESYD